MDSLINYIFEWACEDPPALRLENWFNLKGTGIAIHMGGCLIAVGLSRSEFSYKNGFAYLMNGNK